MYNAPFSKNSVVINIIFYFLLQVMISEGITELLFTSDNYLGLEKEQLSLPNGMLLTLIL